MSISSQTVVAGPFTGNGATTAFPFTIQGISADELIVYEDGEAISSALYSVALTSTGGTVTYTTAPANGVEIFIVSDPLFESGLAISDNGPFLPSAVEDAIDAGVARDLYLKAGIDKLLPDGGLVPGAGAGMFLGLDAEGEPTFLSGTGTDADLRTDLVAAAGGSLVGLTQDISSPTTRTLIQVLRDRPWMLEDKGGGAAKTAAENNTALAAILAQFDAVTTRGVLQLGPGTYQFNDATTFPTYARLLELRGEGIGRSTWKQTVANKNGIVLPNGLNHSFLMRDFSLEGAGTSTSYSGTGMGIFQPYNAGANDSFNLHFENLIISNWGSHAVELLDTFTTSFSRVGVNYCGGYGFIAGGNTLRMESCYVHNMASGKVAYRIFDGNATLIACNGVDTGDYWGRFGRSTSESNDLTDMGANADAYAFVSLYGCNIEAYAVRGLDLWNGVLNVDPTTANTSKAGATGVIGDRRRSSVGRGFMGSQPALGSGGSWANGYGVHTAGGYAPASFVLGLEDTASLSYYDELNSIARTMPYDSMTQVSLGTMGKLWSHARVTGSLGFATGAGGSVTQATSKSTGVTLDKACGQITMHNAALAAGTSVGFTLTNSQIVATDEVRVWIVSGGTVNSYTVGVDAVAGGSCHIHLRNISAGSLGEAVVIGFSVGKAVTS